MKKGSVHDTMTDGDAPESIRWIHEVNVGDTVVFRAGKRGTSLIAQWPGLGTLRCERDGSAASFAAAAGTSPRVIGKLRRAQVRGLLRDLAGGLTVHGAAVAIGGRAVLFIGSDGAGKSTAAAEMCLRHDAIMFADDAASLDVGPLVTRVAPYEEHHWLTRESCRALGVSTRRDAAGKRRLRASNVAREPLPLALVVALRFDPSIAEPVLGPLRGGEAARMLLEGVIRFDLEDAAARRRELDQLTTVHRCATFVSLVRPVQSPGGVARYVMDLLKEDKS